MSQRAARKSAKSYLSCEAALSQKKGTVQTSVGLFLIYGTGIKNLSNCLQIKEMTFSGLR
jgi:hypothetical protein